MRTEMTLLQWEQNMVCKERCRRVETDIPWGKDKTDDSVRSEVLCRCGNQEGGARTK